MARNNSALVHDDGGGSTLPTMPYRRRARLRDRFHGWWDGRLGRPDVKAADLRTAYWRELENEAEKLFHIEEIRFNEAYRGTMEEAAAKAIQLEHSREALSDLRAAVGATRDTLARETARLDALAEPGVKQTAEERQERRDQLFRFNSAHTAAIQRLDQERERVARLEVEIKQLEVKVKLGMQRAATQANLAWRHVTERINVYRQSLCRSHRFGNELDSRLGDTADTPVFQPENSDSEK
ncbi:hypothetical protein Cs7R123_29840 [Catellatospora sp. TT07R-123]|uniref:hypothetical protein n=1 Tax=Catellatospora sp. TT07R-123 TaxID=2733863 RepID=UPI001B226D20|nr:hypothetical protein [Catellatospora sp. TT07R-123]GHJ45642.1 hypothetical protein Cs7R123_29840 [Catellatospora sp. TT07R-123]